ncbi:SGNH hydrolase domain-containing protein [Arthrobacter sp. TMP15]|uniref:SGNH hydrolase domain-containing protein n=1 Tax=Arthrobacter sp. TMP15 TaxID=3140789 RepID=UPI0031BB6949
MEQILTDKYGQTVPVKPPRKTIAIVDDSYAEQITGALMPVAKSNDWQLVSLLLGGCDFGSESVPSARNEKCQAFNKAAKNYVLKLKPDGVFTISTDTVPDPPNESVIPGYEAAVQTFTVAAIDVIGVRDNARSAENIASCVSSHGADDCALQQSEHLAPENPSAFLNEIDGAHMIDLTDQYCKDGICHAVTGNILVYMDDHHLTADFVQTMAPALGTRIAAATGWQVK